ncbi:immunoglobulin domain-containing protein, partial [Alkaliflexus imshenetskii]|uniref:immunoglobulin domain-containing protein n=1 Tax=Alkaliflexus imshenetskii TaxID=286730 RepID=UPI00138AEFB2
MQYQLRRNSTDGIGFYITGTGNPIVFNVSNPEVGVYSVFARNVALNRCGQFMNGTVTVNPLPTVTIGSNAPLCVGETLNLTATGGTSYSWTGPNGFTSSLQNPSIANVTTAMAGTYSVLVVDGNSCERTINTTVAINVNPVVTLNSAEACAGENITLTPVVSNGVEPYTYKWFKDGVEILTETGSSLSFTALTLADAANYSVEVRDFNGCSATIATATLTVNPNPTINPITLSTDPGNAICEGESITLSTLGAGGTGTLTYNWSPISATGNVLTINNATVAQSGTYSVFVSDAKGCRSTTVTREIVVNAIPVAQFITSPSGICLGTSGTFTAATDASYTNYEFFVNGFSRQSGVSSTFVFTPVLAEVGNATIRLVVTNSTGCTDETEIIIPVYDSPAATFTTTLPAEVCINEDKNLLVTLTTGSISPSWSFIYNDGSGDLPPVSVTGVNSSSITVSPLTTTTYTLVSVTDGNGCQSVLNIPLTLTVNPLPTIDNLVNNSSTPLCVGSTIRLDATATGFGSNYVYRWYFD